MLNLNEIEAQCVASLSAARPNVRLIDENLRGYVLLLSAHFQGFCRDLYTESALFVVSKVRPSLQVLVEGQFVAKRVLDHGNPSLKNLREDYERFGFTLDLATADPGNPLRLTHLDMLNRWRNVAAHRGTLPAGVPSLSLGSLQAWRSSCDGLTRSLDAVMYNQLHRLLKRPPW